MLDVFPLPPVNATNNYAAPTRDPLDLKCDCDTITYRCASPQANCLDDGFTDRGETTGAVLLWGAQGVRVAPPTRESLSIGVHSWCLRTVFRLTVVRLVYRWLSWTIMCDEVSVLQ